jgi:hypothetical protein
MKILKTWLVHNWRANLGAIGSWRKLPVGPKGITNDDMPNWIDGVGSSRFLRPNLIVLILLSPDALSECSAADGAESNRKVIDLTLSSRRWEFTSVNPKNFFRNCRTAELR